MKMTPVTFEVEESLYEELLTVTERAGLSIEDYWSERLKNRLRLIFGKTDQPDGQ